MVLAAYTFKGFMQISSLKTKLSLLCGSKAHLQLEQEVKAEN